ncbi:amino acid ABC transporter permease [Peribacillus psychrosaccharolyticus]|uniref:Amino acid ABC transporter permease n=1 Tax=Peribacillus psychrosaccharolyticus TaxID=1407 RepID=A0A974NLN6_PERPY|nr:amino acid ABC transporter permease [Peribacillus psychrosaccharolyticus]MEC2056844.1 amino acid ABC transporter permease [Peribacillus psychrosaccharolyticus]MED3746426.1 amino acid ABC transporter permease [Peribacillus psychrosaccharolyticus]QQT00033.1 amino acid ABC transporter permease [Peribacillus psychrosaccharolyticus]
MNLDFERIMPSIPYILEGIPITLQVVGIAAVIGFVLGILLSLMKISKLKPLNWIADFYTSIFRGTPLVLQLMLIYFGSPQLFGVQIDAFEAAFLSFGLNSAAYISEVIRGGIMAVDKGQMEAAQALGVPYKSSMLNIILPQAFKNILPALMNELITLTKESAVVTIIGLGDIMRRSYIVGGETYKFFEPILIAGLIYYVMVMILTIIGKVIEGRMRRSD